MSSWPALRLLLCRVFGVVAPSKGLGALIGV
jgi:hypothetical protein